MKKNYKYRAWYGHALKKNIFGYETSSCHIAGVYHSIFCIGLLYAEFKNFDFGERNET